MDDETFKSELLTRLDRIQSLLSYLCGAAKASEERAQAALRVQKPAETPLPAGGRSLLQEEMQDDYHQALQKWQSTRER